MRIRFLNSCFCPKYSDGLDKNWKENLNATYDNENVNHAMLCFSTMMYAEWKVMACEKHCAMMKKIVSMIFCEFAKDFRKSLTKL